MSWVVVQSTVRSTGPLRNGDGHEAIGAFGKGIENVAVEADLPGGVGAEAQNEISGVRRIDVDAQVLSRRLALIRGGIEGCIASVLVGRPFQVGALGALAEDRGGGRAEAGFGESHRDERVVGIGRGVLVCAFKARPVW